MSELSDRVFLIMVNDTETGVVFQGTVEADSEVEAREKIKLTLERMFMGAQRVSYDRVPEQISEMMGAMHKAVGMMDSRLAGYHIGGKDEGHDDLA